MRKLAALILVVGVASATLSAASEVADAVQRRDMAALKALLQKKADVNAPQVDGSRAMHWAVHYDNLQAADLLIAAGANLNTPTREGATPLSMAVLGGSVPMARRLLEGGADAKSRGPNGETMLMFAARNGSVEMITLLAATGIDVNAAEELRGTTALMWAAEQQHPGAVRALLAAGADPKAKSGPAGLPRNYIAPRTNTQRVEEARQRRLRAVAAGRTYEEQLAFEKQQGLIQAPPPGSIPGGPVLPQQVGRAGGAGAAGAAGAQAAAQDQDDNPFIEAGLVGSGGGGLSALHFAAREGDIESTRALLDGGADVNQLTEYGWTALLTAVNNRNYRLAQLLLERGADPNIANKGGWTPLYIATDNRNIEGGDYPVPKPDIDHLEIITSLLDKGADANGRIKDNTLTRTIFTMQWFYEDGATPFVRASQSSDTELMKLLLKYKADPKLPTAYGDTALTAAGGIGWVDGVTYERSPQENLEAIRMLLDLGLDPNAANNEGRTALMGAALKGRNDVIQLLVDRGAKLELRDKGSRDTHNLGSQAAGVRWQALDYAEGLVRVGVQSAVAYPEAAKLMRRLMMERGLPVPEENRNILSICITVLCGPQ